MYDIIFVYTNTGVNVLQTLINFVVIFFVIYQLYNYFLVFKVPTITALEAKKLNKKDVLFLDVRSHGEFSNAHIKGARHIPLDQIKKRLNEIPQNTKIVVVCAGGVRSAKGAMRLIKAGYKDVFSLKGGMAAWN